MQKMVAKERGYISIYTEEQRKLWEIPIRALNNYRPKPYLGAATLFRSRGHPLICSFDPQYGWGDLIRGGVTVNIVSCPHDSILEEPFVQSVAAALTKCLEKTQCSGVSGSETLDE